MPVPSLDPSNLWHATYIIRKRDTGAEYLAKIKAALIQAVKHINFVDPFQIRKVKEALMHKVNRDAICIGIKYSVKIEPLYFELAKFIPTLKNKVSQYQHVVVIITPHANMIIQTDSIHKDHPAQDICDW